MRGMRWATALLGAVVALLLVYLVVLIPTGTSLIPGTTTGDSREANVTALRSAANQQLTAFLNQNYRNARASMNQLISGSTGSFHDKLVGSSVTQINATGQLKTKAVGVVQKLSVTRLGPATATLLAVVTQTVRNTQTTKVKKTRTCAAGSVCSRYYLVLSYQRVGGQWKMSNLEYLPL
ncbi:MAG: hypothetical protein ACTHOG_14330 [Marmoricola sp.]